MITQDEYDQLEALTDELRAALKAAFDLIDSLHWEDVYIGSLCKRGVITLNKTDYDRRMFILGLARNTLKKQEGD